MKMKELFEKCRNASRKLKQTLSQQPSSITKKLVVIDDLDSVVEEERIPDKEITDDHKEGEGRKEQEEMEEVRGVESRVQKFLYRDTFPKLTSEYIFSHDKDFTEQICCQPQLQIDETESTSNKVHIPHVLAKKNTTTPLSNKQDFQINSNQQNTCSTIINYCAEQKEIMAKDESLKFQQHQLHWDYCNHIQTNQTTKNFSNQKHTNIGETGDGKTLEDHINDNKSERKKCRLQVIPPSISGIIEDEFETSNDDSQTRNTPPKHLCDKPKTVFTNIYQELSNNCSSDDLTLKANHPEGNSSDSERHHHETRQRLNAMSNRSKTSSWKDSHRHKIVRKK